jgi:hypothetical protein
MTETPFHRDNHYVPRVYLKRWASSCGRLWAYRTLVSASQVQPWKESSIRGVAYHSHLYTRIVAGRESDEFEKWLDREFEAPAEEALKKATSNVRLSPTDWRCIVRFLAAQDVRTPARLLEELQRWHATLPSLMKNSLQKSVRKLELASKTGDSLPNLEVPNGDLIPMRVTPRIVPDQEFGELKCEIIVGRGLWLFGIRHRLTKRADVLLRNKWTILSPPEGLSWITSDDPVIRVNFHDSGRYEGGWDSPGTHILLPLSPSHLLYTQVGERPPRRGEKMTRTEAEIVRRWIAEHAHRMIFASAPDHEVQRLRPRTVNAHLLREEGEHWRRWPADQAAAERELEQRSKNEP